MTVYTSERARWAGVYIPSTPARRKWHRGCRVFTAAQSQSPVAMVTGSALEKDSSRISSAGTARKRLLSGFAITPSWRGADDGKSFETDLRSLTDAQCPATNSWKLLWGMKNSKSTSWHPSFHLASFPQRTICREIYWKADRDIKRLLFREHLI